MIEAISDILNKRKRPKYFEGLKERALKGILSSQFKDAKKDRKLEMENDERGAAVREEAREKIEEDLVFYGASRQYKVTKRGVFVHVTKEAADGDPVEKWVQISRTRIDLLAVTRSSKDDDWGAYIQITNMDGRTTLLAIPRSVINDVAGNIAGQLAKLGVDVVREERERLPDFLLTTVVVVDDKAIDLPRFLAVPTTGWWQPDGGRWCFVLPHTSKYPADLETGGLAIFQSQHLHLQHGFAVAGEVEEWCEQIAAPFAGNSNVYFTVGAALSGPLVTWSGTPRGFSIFFAVPNTAVACLGNGQSIFGPPVIPGESNSDTFGRSWL